MIYKEKQRQVRKPRKSNEIKNTTCQGTAVRGKRRKKQGKVRGDKEEPGTTKKSKNKQGKPVEGKEKYRKTASNTPLP